MEVKNRFVRSATYQGRAKENGEVSNALISVQKTLARGEVGLISQGYMFIPPLEKAAPPSNRHLRRCPSPWIEGIN